METMEHPKKPEVFISYSHADKKWFDELLMQLKPLKDRDLLDCWSDKEIAAGGLWRQDIERALNSAKVAILLVSPEFLASDFIANNELPPLLRAANKGEMKLLWIPVGANNYKHTELAEFQALHPPEKPLNSLRKAERQKSLVAISDKILKAIETGKVSDVRQEANSPVEGKSAAVDDVLQSGLREVPGNGDLAQRFDGPSEGTAVKQTLAGRGRRALRFVLAALAIDIALAWFTRWAAPFTRLTFTFFQLCELLIPLALVAALVSSWFYREESLKRLRMTGSQVVRRWRWRRSSVIFIMLLGALSGPTWGAQSDPGQQPLRQGEGDGRALSPARISYQRAVGKVNDLRQLLSLLDKQESADSEAAAAARALEEELANSRAEVTKASDLVGSSSQCFQRRSLAIEQSAHVIEGFRQAARDSLSRAAELSHSQSLDTLETVVPSSETEGAFQRRFELKRELIARVAEVPAQMQRCSSLLSSTDWAVEGLARAFVQAHQGTRDLLSRADLVRRITQLIVDRAIEVKSRGWLNADVDTSVFPETPALRVLAQRVDILDGMAELNLRDRHTDADSRLQEYQDAVLRLVVEDDARQFLASLAETGAGHCGDSECLYLQEEAEFQRETVLSLWEDAEARRLEVERIIQMNPGLGIFGSSTTSWADNQSAIEEAFDLAKVEVKTRVALAARLQASLRDPVAEALDKAIAERRAAYEQVFGFPEPPGPPPPSPEPPPPPSPEPPPPPSPPPFPAPILRHAFEVLTLRAKESEGYGAYTYVIFPVRDGASPEYQALLSAIVALTPAASPDTPRSVRSTTNLFVIPGKSAEPIDPDEEPAYAVEIENYDWKRALSLVQTANAGVLSTPKVLERFRRSPGPFLLTLPVPIEQARGVTQLLLADLNGYPAVGFKDLVKSYQNDLVNAFPTHQAIWHPPWKQSLALELISIGAALGGQNFVDLGR